MGGLDATRYEVPCGFVEAIAKAATKTWQTKLGDGDDNKKIYLRPVMLKG